MKTLYFDIDGTILLDSFGQPKAKLAEGALERAVRDAGFEGLVCVGNAVAIVQALERSGMGPDGLGTILRVCQGAFQDEAWFRSVTTLVQDSEARVEHIELTGDWYYVDDLAEEYSRRAGALDWYREHLDGRIFVPEPDGDGQDVLDWLAGVEAS